MNSVNKTARVAGLLYLLLLPLGIFGILYVPATLVVPGDGATTVTNIIASASLFRLSIVSALMVQIVNMAVVLVLYRLLKPVNKTVASLMVIFLLVAVPIAMLNEINRAAVLLLVSDTDSLTGFAADQRQALVALFLGIHTYGVNIASIFWGLWLLPMGYLVFRSGFLPRILGVLLIIGGFGYLVDFFTHFLLPNYGVTVSQFTFIGEILFPLWLLIKGVSTEQWKDRVRESAGMEPVPMG
jgi:hypothetical protein